MEQDTCPALEFLLEDEANTRASRNGLLLMLQHVAANGFDGIPAAWSHEVNKDEGIYEFIKMNFIKRMNFIIYKEKLTDLENQLMIIWKKYIGVVGH